MKKAPQGISGKPSQLEMSALGAELLRLSDSAREKLLANKIYNSLLRFFHLKDNALSVLFLALLVGVLLLFAKAAVSSLFYPAPFLFPLGSVLASFLISFSLAAVKILHDMILPPNAKKMLGFIDKKAVLPLRRWFASFLSYKRQILFSSLFGLLACVTLYGVDILTTADFDAGDYFLGSLAIFCVSHGGYCGLSIPTIAKPLCRGEMRLFWLNPADSEPIKIASWGFRLLSLADSIFVALCIVALYWFRPWESKWAAAISAIWLIAGLLAVSYSFFYPHYYLDKAIKSNRKRSLQKLEAIIESYYSRIDKLRESEFGKLSEYIALYERLSKTRETSIDISALRIYLTSVIIPTLSFAAGLIDFKLVASSLFL